MRTSAEPRVAADSVLWAWAGALGRRAASVPRWALLPASGALVAVGVCLAFSRAVGLPLDDAWIHQDFARTLATTGRFTFQPGHGAAGETSPAWVLLLLPPYLLTHGQPPVGLVVGWAGTVGAVVLAALGITTGVAAAVVTRRTGAGARTARVAAGLAGLAAVSEWHLAWAAASGMETDLFALLAMALIVAAGRGLRAAWLGLLAAATILARPEGLVVTALVVAAAAWEATHRHARVGVVGRGRDHTGVWARLRQWGLSWLPPFLAALSAGLIPYVLLNLLAGGAILPSTVVAKTGEFQQGGDWLPRVAYYLAAVVGLRLLLASPVLLVLGALAGAWRLGRGLRGAGPVGASVADDGRGERVIGATSGGGGLPYPSAAFPLTALLGLWPVVLLLAYAGHLGAEYQHNRYLIPALPPLLVLAAAGAAPLLAREGARLLGAAGGVLTAVAMLFSAGHAVQLTAADVQTINCTQVDAGLWLREHTPPRAVVATHDVGAIGYFSGRPLVDITGLVDPEVVPVAHDEAALRAYLVRRHVAYLAIYSNWFPALSRLSRDLAGHAIYQTCGGRPMYDADGARYLTIYRTGWDAATRVHGGLARGGNRWGRG